MLEHIRRVHFVGVGGIGMSALARLLIFQGVEVSGSDRVPDDQGRALAQLGATIQSGHDARHIDGADLVVVSSAIAPDNCELMQAQAEGTPVVKRAELLAFIVNKGRGVAIAGTHGKTTTGALTGWILVEAGMNPTILIGGISANLESNARVGSDLVVAEADEYDGSFLPLLPRLAAITNIEPDHLDYFGTFEKVRTAFRRFAEHTTDVLVVCADDPLVPDTCSTSQARLVTYGLREGDHRVIDIEETGSATTFAIVDPSGTTRYSSGLAGPHHVLNATAAILLARELGVSEQVIQRAVGSYRGVARRLELKGEARGVIVMDDYAHHPTEIRADLAAIKQRFGRPLRVVFQPHTYSRTHDFLEEFASSFDDADSVYLLDIYAAREVDKRGISGRDLSDATMRKHHDVSYTKTMDHSFRALSRELRTGDMVVTMGAGDVYRLGDRLLAMLRQK